MVVEAGRYTLADGTVLEANWLTTDHRWTPHLFRSEFTETPIVLTSVMSDSEDSAVAVRLNEISSTGFRVKLQEEEASRQSAALKQHADEHLGYVAISAERYRVSANSVTLVSRSRRFPLG